MFEDGWKTVHYFSIYTEEYLSEILETLSGGGYEIEWYNYHRIRLANPFKEGIVVMIEYIKKVSPSLLRKYFFLRPLLMEGLTK